MYTTRVIPCILFPKVFMHILEYAVRILVLQLKYIYGLMFYGTDFYLN